MDPGKALGASIEIIKMLYETAETYQKLERLNSTILNEIALLITLQDQIKNCRRMENNIIVDNYLIDINYKLEKFQKLIVEAQEGNFFKKIVHTKKIKKIASEIANLIKKLKFLLDIKREMLQSSKLDVANIINDPEARKFWEDNFGSEHTYIQVNLFFSAIRMNTGLLSNEIDFLKKVINDDDDKYITAFEFQEWLDFFGDFSVVMRRTIESLFDPNTLEVVDWYHKNISKSLVNALLKSHIFIIRKHTNQKGVFIVNFLDGADIGTLYIRNINNEFVVERVSSMSPAEIKVYEMLDQKKFPNLMELGNRLGKIINPNEAKYIPNWEENRSKLKDEDLSPFDPLNSIKSIFEAPVDAIKQEFSNIKNTISEGVGSIWNNVGCFRK